MKKQTEIKNLNCRQALDKVYEYIDREVDARTEQEIKKHLSTCLDCYGKFRFEKMLKEKIRKLSVKKDASNTKMKLDGILKKIA